jgi:hypothetical protein
MQASFSASDEENEFGSGLESSSLSQGYDYTDAMHVFPSVLSSFLLSIRLLSQLHGFKTSSKMKYLEKPERVDTWQTSGNGCHIVSNHPRVWTSSSLVQPSK